MRLSVSDIGGIALKSFCSRCFWLKKKTKNQLPYRVPPPGIFANIESYMKKIVVNRVKNHTVGDLIKELDGAEKLVKSDNKTYEKFFPELNCFISGMPDSIFSNSDNSFSIAEFKTARFTSAQMDMINQYELQLQTYAMLVRDYQIKPISKLLLVYFEPHISDLDIEARSQEGDTISLDFSPFVHSVKQNDFEVYSLIKRAVSIIQSDEAPQASPSCRDCDSLNNIIKNF